MDRLKLTPAQVFALKDAEPLGREGAALIARGQQLLDRSAEIQAAIFKAHGRDEAPCTVQVDGDDVWLEFADRPIDPATGKPIPKPCKKHPSYLLLDDGSRQCTRCKEVFPAEKPNE